MTRSAYFSQAEAAFSLERVSGHPWPQLIHRALIRFSRIAARISQLPSGRSRRSAISELENGHQIKTRRSRGSSACGILRRQTII
jgi:hypothetical protein